MIQPGSEFPHLPFQWQDAPGEGCTGSAWVLVFFPHEATGLLERFAERHADFAKLGVALIGVGVGDLPERPRGIDGFDALASLPGEWSVNGWLAENDLLPGVLVVDRNRIVRRVYTAGEYPALPNPAMVIRAARSLLETPAPPPVRENEWTLGAAGARITLIEYADYECGPCGEAYRALAQVLPGFGDQVRLVHRHLPLRHSHPLAQLSAEAAEAAGAQGRFWEMHARLFSARGDLAPDRLVAYAAELGLDLPRFKADLESHTYAEAVNADFKEAVSHGIKRPPALFINGVPYDGPRTPEALHRALSALLEVAQA